MTGKPIVISNGGSPLPGCPKSWDDAHAWEGTANENKEGCDPKWKFDCGFKLDFDGELLGVSSRFYPPKSGYGPTWDGSVCIEFAGKRVHSMQFDCETLDSLRKEVEQYVDDYTRRVWQAIASMPDEPKDTPK